MTSRFVAVLIGCGPAWWALCVGLGLIGILTQHSVCGIVIGWFILYSFTVIIIIQIVYR